MWGISVAEIDRGARRLQATAAVFGETGARPSMTSSPLRAVRPLHVPDSVPRVGRRAGRRCALLGAGSFLGALVIGSLIVPEPTIMGSIGQYDSFLTDLAAPAAALVAVVLGSVGGASGSLAAGDRVVLGVSLGIVGLATAGSWVWIGFVPSLTPLILGTTALVVMRSALIERTARTLASRPRVPGPRASRRRPQ